MVIKSTNNINGFFILPILFIFFIISFELIHYQKSIYIRAKLDSKLNEFLNLKSTLINNTINFLTEESNNHNLNITKSIGKYGEISKLSLPNLSNPSALTFTQNTIKQINWRSLKNLKIISQSNNLSITSLPEYPILIFSDLDINTSSVFLAAETQINNQLKFNISKDVQILASPGLLSINNAIVLDSKKEIKTKKLIIAALEKISVQSLDNYYSSPIEIIIFSMNSIVSITKINNLSFCDCSQIKENSCYKLTNSINSSSTCLVDLPKEITARAQIIGQFIEQ